MTPTIISFQVDLDSEYDVVQKIGEGWFSRVYLTEHRATREEVALKAISAATVTAEEFLREYQHAYRLSAHKNILTVYDVAFQVSAILQCFTPYMVTIPVCKSISLT